MLLGVIPIGVSDELREGPIDQTKAFWSVALMRKLFMMAGLARHPGRRGDWPFRR
jgi:hypothetical protein